MNSNGWVQKGIFAILGAAMGAGGLWITRHDLAVGANATTSSDIQMLKEFKREIDTNVEVWRGDRAAYELRMSSLESSSKQAARERAAMFRWMERVSVKLNIEAPAVPQSDARKRDLSGFIAGQDP